MALLYSDIDTENILVSFGKTVRESNLKHQGASSLNASLAVFELTYSQLGDRLLKLIEHLEQ